MREIKFRAWEKDEKAVGAGTMWDVREFDFTREKAYVGLHESDLENLAPMQFTGIKDKNGRDIYEGDIVLIPDTYTDVVVEGRGPIEPANHLSEVVFVEGSFKFRVSEDADILSKGDYTWGWLGEETGNDELEVIGNKYENPELCANKS